MISALFGGILVGLSAAVLLLGQGRILGVSGIVGGLVPPGSAGGAWRVAFVAGLVVTGLLVAWVAPQAVAYDADRGLAAILLAGLLVGFGTSLGNGCTSGHGVCGISRLSARSLVATVTFMGTGVVTVFVVNHVIGGAR